MNNLLIPFKRSAIGLHLCAIAVALQLGACTWPAAAPADIRANTQTSENTKNTQSQNYSVQHFDAQLLKAITQRQLGRPYLFGGNTPSGFDCSGLVQYSFKQMGISLPRATLAQLNELRPIAKQDLRNGDLVFFKTGRKQYHVGIMSDANNFIHAPSSGQTVSQANLNNPYWKKTYLAARRY